METKKRRTRGRINAARRRDFPQNLGDVYSAGSDQVELAKNISYALLRDATYRNGQLPVAKHPTKSVVLYETGREGPKIDPNGNSSQKRQRTST